ncbi:divergent polysaccharide deacetylase family protein [Megalodesulfovibrio gigas]|nr:divergent polysaccharide deacetylase family protein [Megalodesulfovibrio gigas]
MFWPVPPSAANTAAFPGAVPGASSGVAPGTAAPGVFEQSRIVSPPTSPRPASPSKPISPISPPGHAVLPGAFVNATPAPLASYGHPLDTPTKIIRPVVHPDAFEEALGAPMELTVRQVDAALLEALQQHGLPPERLELLEVGQHSDVEHRYLFQRLSLRLEEGAAALRQTLQALLARQVPRASLELARPTLWRIRIMNRLTHEIVLSSSRAPAFRPVEGARLTIVIDDMGASLSQARELLALPAPVVFSILPYTEHAREVAELAHAAGREVLVHLPMEPVNLRISPGRDALMVGMDDQTISRLTAVNLAGVPHAVGVNNHMGSRFTQQAELTRPALEVIRSRGLFVLDSLTHERSRLAQTSRAMGLPTYRRDVFLDVVRDATTILHQIRKAEHLALQHGQAIAIGHPHPETFEALRRWAAAPRPGITAVSLSDLDVLADPATLSGQ